MTLFKAVDTSEVPANCIDQDAVKYHISTFQRKISWATMRPIVDTAEEKHILPVIGSELYEELVAAYTAYPGSSLPTKKGILIRKLQKAIAYFAHHVAIPELITSTGDLGPVETQDSANTSVIPRQWTIRTALRHSFITGHEKLQLALQYLEANADDTEFTTYKSSSAYSAVNTYFIRGAQDLKTLIPTEMPYVVWKQLVPYMEQAERRYIEPVLGKEFFAEMKAAVAGGSLSAIQLECLGQIHQALIHWVNVHAIPHLRFAYSENGLLEVQGDTDGALSFQRPARSEAVNTLWLTLKDAGRYMLVNLKAWLEEHADDLGTYKNSSAYNAKTPHTGGIYCDEDGNPLSTYGFG